MALKIHELSACHREAVEVVIHLPSTTKHIGVHISQQYAMEMVKSKRMLLRVLSSIRFLAREALPLRGHNDDSDGNFIQLLKLQDKEDSDLLEWLQKKVSKYTSPDIQNDLIKLMAVHIMRNIAEKLQDSQFITIMVDETTDVTNQEQVTLVMRRIDENFDVYEEFLGLYNVTSIDAATLFPVIKGVMLRFNFPFKKTLRAVL